MKNPQITFYIIEACMLLTIIVVMICDSLLSQYDLSMCVSSL